jgi:hypothetical protein
MATDYKIQRDLLLSLHVIEELLQAFINITMPNDGAFNYLEVNDGLLLQQLMAAERYNFVVLIHFLYQFSFD